MRVLHFTQCFTRSESTPRPFWMLFFIYCVNNILHRNNIFVKVVKLITKIISTQKSYTINMVIFGIVEPDKTSCAPLKKHSHYKLVIFITLCRNS